MTLPGPKLGDLVCQLLYLFYFRQLRIDKNSRGNLAVVWEGFGTV